MKKKKKDSRNQSTVASYSARIAQKHWMYSDIYIEGKREYKQKTKKKVSTAATVLLGIVATIQNLKKKKCYMNSEKCCMNSAKIL